MTRVSFAILAALIGTAALGSGQTPERAREWGIPFSERPRKLVREFLHQHGLMK